MKLYIKNLILFCSLVSVLTSCDLDVVPPAEISAENFWKTEKDAWYALNGCYQSMPAVDIWDEMCTDNAHSHKPWEGNMEMVQQNGINTAAPYGNYDFNAIRTANTYIARVDECDMSEELKVRTKAEARFFRAFAYLTLTQYFGKVAIVTEELPYDASTIARNSVEEVRNFILTELAEVAEILLESYSGGFMNEIGRVTRYAALALRSRAALYFGNYEEAEKSAKAVIDSGKYSLFKLTSLNAAQEQEAGEMDLYIDFAELGIDKDKFIKGMFSYEALWQGANATPANPEYVLTHEYICLKDLVYEIESIITHRAADEDIQWIYEKNKEDIPYPYVYGSSLHLRQIFLNIYGNCIKYNRPGGKITTVMEAADVHDGICTYRWTISDTGVGMSPEFLSHIFDPFSQEKTDARSVYQGTGLGMSIAKALFEQMGGNIEVFSKLGEGSTFVITLPFERAQELKTTVIEKTEKESIQDIKILLAEDNELNQEVARILLEEEGAKVFCVNNGQKAVEAFSTHPAGSYDLILMDIMMPVMGGYEATRQIRRLDRTDARFIPIIALTANAFAEDIQHAMDAGMNAHVAKPLNIKTIKKIIINQLK